MPNDVKTFMVEDAQLLFRNFSGEETQFNKAGERNFCVILDQNTANAMLKDGWNIKTLQPREDEEGEVGTPYIQVKVGFKFKPPTIVVLTDTSRTRMSEETVGTLDWAEIRTVDLIARAVDWEVNGKTGIKAYLQTMFVTIEEDALERKYAIMEGE